MHTKILSAGLLVGGLLMVGAGCSANPSTMAPAPGMEKEKPAMTEPTTGETMMATDTTKSDAMMPKDASVGNTMMETTSAMQKKEDTMQPAMEKSNTTMNDTDNMKK